MKERLDVLLVKQGLAESREKAKAVIMAGEVFVQGQREDKAGAMFDESKVTITVKGSSLRYVSRGGLKLEKAMACFPITLEGDICMDIGSSTGGFTDCMLQNGAKKVYSVDVGHGQLAWKLRQDERVVCMEKTNFRYLTRDQIADDLIEAATYSGCFNSDFWSADSDMLDQYYYYDIDYGADRYFNSTYHRVQLGERMWVEISKHTYIKGLGMFEIPVTVSVKKSGLSEKYWK